MNTYKIDVNVVEATGTAAGKVLQVNPEQMEVKAPSLPSEGEPARVTWTFKNLPAGLTPVITFDSPAVIASGPTTTLGALPQVSCEIRFPAGVSKDAKVYPAGYKISVSSALNKKHDEFPSPVEGPSLVVVRTPDPPPIPPPGNGAPVQASSNADVQ
jgi:hypothetical protein